MKYTWPLLVCLLLTACADKPQPAVDVRPTLVPKDSVVQADSLNPFAPLDRSPMDMSYFPNEFPVQSMMGKSPNQPFARIIYSRPQRQGSSIFGSLIKYGEPWRLGANEATELELFKPARIKGKAVNAGRYILYAVPGEKEWTIVLNAGLYSWGLRQDDRKDLVRFSVPVQTLSQPVEYFSMVFQPASGGTDLLIAWDTVFIRVPFQF